MADSPMYNDATLAKQEAKRKLGITFAQPQEPGQVGGLPPYQEEPSADGIIAGAKGFLAQPNSTEPDALDRKLAALRIPQGEHFDTEPIIDVPRYIGKALSGEWIGDQFAESGHPLVGAGVNMALMGPNFMGTALNGLRKLTIPGADESRIGGAVDTAVGLGGLKSALKGVPSARAFAESKLPESWQKLANGRKEVPYKAFTSKPDPIAPGTFENQDLGPALERLRATIGKHGPMTAEAPYAQDLGRAASARPTANATAVFDKMSGNGAFGPGMEAFTDAQYGPDNLLSPLDRLARLAKSRIAGQSIRTSTPLPSEF